jgi:hypothetical protein
MDFGAGQARLVEATARTRGLRIWGRPLSSGHVSIANPSRASRNCRQGRMVNDFSKRVPESPQATARRESAVSRVAFRLVWQPALP